MRIRPRLVPVLVLVALAAAGPACGNDDDDEKPAPSEPASIEVSGNATFDGEPFDADFVGAVVLADGLATPCQAALPKVEGGRYSIPVLSATGGSGCGKAGAKVVLWTFTHDAIHYSTESLTWPAGDRATFDPSFSSADRQGASPEVAQFSGEVFEADGSPAPVGTEVEAFVGDARCGIASVRRSGEFLGYVISVVGPDEVDGCERDVALSFHVDGKPADHNPVVNRPPGVRDAVDLRL